MFARRRLALAALPCAALAVASACKSSPPPAASTNAGAIVIGVSLPLTGGFSGVGQALDETLLVAAAQINAVGGVRGRPIELRVSDDSSEPGSASEVASELLGEPIAGFLGPLGSSQVLAVQSLTSAKKVTEITAWATSPLLISSQPMGDRYLFMTVPPDTRQALVMARLVYDGVPRAGDAGIAGGGCRSASFVNTDDAYGNALAALTKASFTARAGAHVASEDTIPTDLAQSYKSLAAKIVAAKPDCLVLVAHAETGAQVQRDVKAAIKLDTSRDWSRFFVAASDAQYDPSYIARGQSDPSDPISDNSTAGTIGQAADTAPDTSDYRAFVNLYQTQFPGKTPPPFSANQFDAAILLALAIEQAGTATPGTEIRDALFAVSKGGEAFGPAEIGNAIDAIRKHIDIDYRGASGDVDFDEAGTVSSDYIVWDVEKQKDGTFAFVTIGRVPASELH
jgi:ABC-type branched-subunit amino acid transport system substrate-binding protein